MLTRKASVSFKEHYGDVGDALKFILGVKLKNWRED